MLGRANAESRMALPGQFETSWGASPMTEIIWLDILFRRESLAICGGAISGNCESRVTRGHVTTYRPEDVVNRADRTPVAVGPDKIGQFDKWRM
jgi:hypothetical protein